MKSSNSMVLTILEYRQNLLVAPCISSISHNSGGVTTLGEKIIFKSEESPLDDDESGVGGLNRTPCLVKPLVTVSLSFKSYVTSMMNTNPNLGIPPKIQSQKDDTFAMAQTKSTRMLNLLWLNQTPKT
jgi:hypothetical protein